MNEDNLKSKLEAWLADQGYPLEFAASNAFRNAGFNVFQGYHVDGEHDSRREIDVLAQSTSREDEGFSRVSFVAECKWSNDKPWVVFVAGGGIATSACIAQSMGSESCRAILWARNGAEELQSLNVFRTPRPSGFGGRQAFSNNRDVFFDAMESVTQITSSYVNQYKGRDLEDSIRAVVIAFPVLVVKTRLFEASYDENVGQLCVNERPQTRIHWRGAKEWPAHATVDIVTEAHLSEFIDHCRKDTDVLLPFLQESAKSLRECVSSRSLQGLKLNRASTGLSGRPSLLRRLDKWFSAPPPK